jgi:hypothetical protein
VVSGPEEAVHTVRQVLPHSVLIYALRQDLMQELSGTRTYGTLWVRFALLIYYFTCGYAIA